MGSGFCIKKKYLIVNPFFYLSKGAQMSYLGIPCDFCGAMKVTYKYAPNGYVIYTCEECGEHWKND